ncbi:MAG: DUF4124 domain-containing protein [Pseudomonadales bacterium]
MKRSLIIAGIAAALVASSAFAKDYYKWTDDNGITQYAEQPPVGVKAEKVTTHGGSSTVYDPNAEYAKSEEGKKEQAHKKELENQAQDLEKQEQEKCDKVEAQVKTMKERGRVRMVDKDGKERVLTPEEQAAKIMELEKYLKETCEKKK